MCLSAKHRDIAAAVDRQRSFQANKLYYVVNLNC